MSITIQVQVDSKAIERKVSSVIDDTAMLRIHNAFARYCNPYVPMDEGALSQTLEITAEGVTYRQPYAHYMYVGMVYGPNIPIFEDGIIVGWFSPPGKEKHPTGRAIQYSPERHPLATKEWDIAMMRDRGDAFCDEVRRILENRAREIYG